MRKRILVWVWVILLLAACTERAQEPTRALSPTPEAAAETPVAQVTDTPEPTATLPPTATVRSTPTAAPTATPEPPTPTAIVPTATATAAAPPSAVPVTIDEPAAQTPVDVGSNLAVSGTGPRENGPVIVALEAAGLVLVETSAMPDANGQWSAVLEVPTSATGDLLLRATAGGQTANQQVRVQRPSVVPPFITLVHPASDWRAVSGHALLFQGRVQRPPDGLVNIALLYDDCRRVGAEQSFDVGPGGRYWGYIVIPGGLTGPACAVASFGEPGEESWQAASVMLEVLPPDDPEARGLFLGNFPDDDVPRGQPVTVYGSAYNAPNRQVQVGLEVNGRRVAEEIVVADSFGFWEVDLVLPASIQAGSSGQFVATVAYPGDPETMSVPFVVVEPPAGT